MMRKIVTQLIVPSRQRRFLTFLLALIAGTGMSLQAENVEIDGIAYEFSDTTATVVENVKRIGWMNYNYSGPITIPATVEYEGVTYTVTKIGNGAFEHAYDETDGVTSVSIPSTVTSIGSMAFYSCGKMTSITCAATTPPTCGSNCFEGVPKNIPVYVPAQSLYAYQQATGWSEFPTILPIPGTEFQPEEDIALWVVPLDGEERQFAFALIGQITFDEQNMYLYDHQGELLGQQPLTSIRRIIFREMVETPTALSSPLSQIRAYPVPAHDKLIVEGVESGMVRIYSMQGALLTSAPVVDGKAQVPVADLPNGNYLLQAGVEIIKFIKK